MATPLDLLTLALLKLFDAVELETLSSRLGMTWDLLPGETEERVRRTAEVAVTTGRLQELVTLVRQSRPGSLYSTLDLVAQEGWLRLPQPLAPRFEDLPLAQVEIVASPGVAQPPELLPDIIAQIRQSLPALGGHVIQGAGRSLLVGFDETSKAVSWVVALLRWIAWRGGAGEVPSSAPPPARAALHQGRVDLAGGCLRFGRTLGVLAHLAVHARPGSILASGIVYEKAGSPAEWTGQEPLVVPGSPRPQTVYAVEWETERPAVGPGTASVSDAMDEDPASCPSHRDRPIEGSCVRCGRPLCSLCLAPGQPSLVCRACAPGAR
ncbi:MAG: hypothetical protein HY815_31955 [Candidatus Riflebacteria bacterium]|nr:hypothetical protein [Candidatus Riflebacteria bacterium]